jgi:hypothetical protein
MGRQLKDALSQKTCQLKKLFFFEVKGKIG